MLRNTMADVEIKSARTISDLKKLIEAERSLL